MDADTAQLQRELTRLHARLERMETMLRSVHERRTIDSSDVHFFAAFLLQLVVFVCLWNALG